uniref:Uncharacterized protein n=1 Tax=Glossina palpalis gambiensis TaxID=67801 RepID=A0A1B0BD86_9MUSC
MQINIAKSLRYNSHNHPPISSPSLPSTSSDAEFKPETPEQRTFTHLNPFLMKPFIGLPPIKHHNDPWLHKPYNLHKPIFHKLTTSHFSPLKRFKRSTLSATSSHKYVNSWFAKMFNFQFYKIQIYRTNPIATNRRSKHLTSDLVSTTSSTSSHINVLTPDLLKRLLTLNMNFEKRFPILYKLLMGHYTNDKYTELTITPPIVGENISIPNLVEKEKSGTKESEEVLLLLQKLKKKNFSNLLRQEGQSDQKTSTQNLDNLFIWDQDF